MVVRSQLPRKKAPNPTDQHVGSRVRMRRMMLAMSQGRLADALGVTYQHVQRNENGINRIGASLLQQISHILQVPVAFFFEGAPNASAGKGCGLASSRVHGLDPHLGSLSGCRSGRSKSWPKALCPKSAGRESDAGWRTGLRNVSFRRNQTDPLPARN